VSSHSAGPTGTNSLAFGVLIPAAAGAVLSVLLSFGIVYSQVSAPSTNPAEKPILSYGTN
jgi:hypothetical protein